MIFTMKLFSSWVSFDLNWIGYLDLIERILDWPKEERSRNVKLILREKLPVENYELFKYIVEFLVQVGIPKVF